MAKKPATAIRTPTRWLIGLAIAGCCSLGSFDAVQYLRARQLFRTGRDLELGSQLSPQQIRKLSGLSCRRSTVADPSSDSARTENIDCEITFLPLHPTGLQGSAYVMSLVVSNDVLVRKDEWLYYRNRAGIGVGQQVRGYGYHGMPDPSVPQREVDHGPGITRLREDDQLSHATLRQDWNLPLDCLWRNSACEAWSQIAISTNP